MVAVMRPFDEVVSNPSEVSFTASELGKLADSLKSLDGERRVFMEYTGSYYLPAARVLHDAGLYVSVVHAKLIHSYDNDSIRRVKTDKADAVKIANYGLDKWNKVRRWEPADDARHSLKMFSRQYNHYIDLRTMLKNNLISILDQTFPGVNVLFTSPSRLSDGHEKWVDFASRYWHCECVSDLSLKKFSDSYKKWCAKNGYYFSADKADDIYRASCGFISVIPKNDDTKALVTNAVTQINAVSETISATRAEMVRIASALPEWSTALSMFGVGELLGSQLIAEIGNIENFKDKHSLIAFAGLDAPPNQLGQFESHSRHISKRGSPHLRKTLFQVISVIIKNKPADNEIYNFYEKKRSEGKHFYVCMTAASAKFLRVYFGKVRATFSIIEAAPDLLTTAA
jgi:transposase